MSDTSDTLNGECLLGDTGFQQPPVSDSPEPVGDVGADEDLPELEDVASSGGAAVLGRKSGKRSQGQKSVRFKKSEEELHVFEKELLESGKAAKEEQVESSKAANEEELENRKTANEGQLENKKEANEEQIKSEETKEKRLESEEETKEEQLESGETKEERLESGETKEEQLESGEKTKEEQLESGEKTKEEQLESGEKTKEEQLISKEQRRELYKEAKALQEAEELDKALEKFTAALAGVRPQTAFPELPMCLRALAEIYYKREEYEKAVHFVQAEKMYYEAALLDTSVLQRILNKDVKRSLIEDKDDAQLQKLRADEYETLARFCVDKKELQLALEYAAKAAKLREATFGPDHEETTRSLDFMTSIYADLGKQEYAESLEKFERSKENPSATGPETLSAAAPSVSVGQRQEGENFDREVRISLFFFAIMVFIAFGVLTCVSAYAYCKLTVSPLCESAASILSEQLSWFHYHLHKWLL